MGEWEMDYIAQGIIFIFGVTAVFLVGRLDDSKKYGYLCGLIAQPAWFYTTITNEQYGITLLSILYTYSWAKGAYNYWIVIERSVVK